jgi:hypothetical protein
MIKIRTKEFTENTYNYLAGIEMIYNDDTKDSIICNEGGTLSEFPILPKEAICGIYGTMTFDNTEIAKLGFILGKFD